MSEILTSLELSRKRKNVENEVFREMWSTKPVIRNFFREAQRELLQNYHDVTTNPDLLLRSHLIFCTRILTLSHSNTAQVLY